MRDSRFEELISAYLDDDLSSEERSLVEQRLAESAEFRVLFEQFQQQQRLLRALVRRPAPRDLSASVLERLNEALPQRSSAEEKRHGGARFKRVIMAVATTLAAGLLIAVIVYDMNRTKPGGSVAEVGPLEVDVVALERFQQRFQYLTVLDVSLNQAGQQARVVENGLAKSGIGLRRALLIEDRLEKSILESRFVGEERVGPQAPAEQAAKDDIQMIFVRGTLKQLNDFHIDMMMNQGVTKTVTDLRMDLIMTPKEMAIFLKLNDTANPNLTDIREREESWKQPGAFPLKFKLVLHSQSLARLGAITGPGLSFEPVDAGGSDAAAQLPELPAGGAGADPGNDPNQPSQMLVIVRNLKS